MKLNTLHLTPSPERPSTFCPSVSLDHLFYNTDGPISELASPCTQAPMHPSPFTLYPSSPERTCVAEVDADRKRSTSQKLTPHDAKTRIGQKRGAPSPCSPPKLIDGELFQMSIRKRYLQKTSLILTVKKKVKEKGKSRMHTCTNRFNMCILSGNATTHRMCFFFPYFYLESKQANRSDWAFSGRMGILECGCKRNKMR